MGFKNITVMDFDKVALHNCASQGFSLKDVGKYKSDVLFQEMITNDNAEHICLQQKWTPYTNDYMVYDYVFLAADCMTTRKAAVNYFHNRLMSAVIIDSRMLGETMRILCIYDDASYQHYKSTLFSNSERMEAGCTSQTTLYCSKICAGLAIQRMIAHNQGRILNTDYIYDLTTESLISKNASNF